MNEHTQKRPMIDIALQLWRRRKWLMIVSFLLVFSVIAGLIMALPFLYRSSTTILFGQDDISETLVKTTVPNELEQRLGIIRQAVLSRSQLQEVIDTFDLYGPLKKEAPPESVIDRMRKDIHIEQRAYTQPQWGQNSTFAITISYQGWDPELVAQVTNDLAARFKAENRKIRTSQATRTTEFIGEELKEAKQEFITQESRINEFREQHMGELPEQQQLNLTTLERLNSELRLNGEKQVQLLVQRDAAMGGSSGGSQSSAAVAYIGNPRLEQLKRELARLRATYTDSHPEIIRLQKEIDTLTAELAARKVPTPEDTTDIPWQMESSEMTRDLASLKASAQQLRASIAALMRRIEGTPRIDQQLKRFTYDYENAKEKYMSLQKLYQDALLAQSLESQQNQQFKVIEVAIPANFPVAPNRFRLLFAALVVASGFSAAVLFLAEQLNRNFHSVIEVRQFTRVPVLANIINIRTRGDLWRSAARFSFMTVLVCAALVLLTHFSYQAGQGAEQLVWTIAG